MANRPLDVWVVDDDQSVRWVLEKALKQADMEPRSFERAEHLLEALDEGRPDVLITDVRMPGMSGIALLERLRSTCPELPIIEAIAPVWRPDSAPPPLSRAALCTSSIASSISNGFGRYSNAPPL